MEDSIKTTKRRNSRAGKVDISRIATDSIITEQIDRLRQIADTSDEAAAKVRESVAILYEKRIPIDTEKFEQLNHYFIGQMEHKLRKVKRPSKGLVWYIVMWTITLLSAFLAGFYIQESKNWKKDAAYWYQMYDNIRPTKQ